MLKWHASWKRRCLILYLRLISMQFCWAWFCFSRRGRVSTRLLLPSSLKQNGPKQNGASTLKQNGHVRSRTMEMWKNQEPTLFLYNMYMRHAGARNRDRSEPQSLTQTAQHEGPVCERMYPKAWPLARTSSGTSSAMEAGPVSWTWPRYLLVSEGALDLAGFNRLRYNQLDHAHIHTGIAV